MKRLDESVLNKCIKRVRTTRDCRSCHLLEELKEYRKINLTIEQLLEIDKLYLEKCEEVNLLKAELEEYKKMKGE